MSGKVIFVLLIIILALTGVNQSMRLPASEDSQPPSELNDFLRVILAEARARVGGNSADKRSARRLSRYGPCSGVYHPVACIGVQ
ncbi:hypothetical protein BOX15_Mlig027246g1 [Macrostomum lignano]|uniref:Uncharacterized protein n=1 Tax=Macrostomum lignano TaxID=282301 RepID=A0A267F929_9PLAT|nr:hypothetical protein BOX15_Mlig027246g1 [Macrostomum lignano]